MTQFVRTGSAAAAALMMLFGLTGCESFLEPSSVPGTYVLESVGGVPIPAVVWEDEMVRATILADTIRLQPDGTGTRVYALDVDYLNDPQRDGKTVIDRRIHYRLDGGDFELTHICGPAELCVPSPHWTGRITSGELRLVGDPGPYVYRRADQ